jgi:hypothetical protein
MPAIIRQGLSVSNQIVSEDLFFPLAIGSFWNQILDRNNQRRMADNPKLVIDGLGQLFKGALVIP